MQISYFYLGFGKIESGFNFPPRLSTFDLHQPSTFNLQPTTFDFQLATFDFQLATFDLKFIL
jgi:hypothetical protein